MPVRFHFEVDDSGFRVKMEQLNLRMGPYIRYYGEKLVEWAKKNIIEKTPEPGLDQKTMQPRTRIKGMWTVEHSRHSTIDKYLIRNLYKNQDVLAYLEYGTPAHAIVARRVQYLHFWVDQREVFTKKVWHPGQKAHEMIADTEENIKQQADTYIKELMKQVQTLAGKGLR